MFRTITIHFMFRTRAQRIQYSQFGKKLFTSGTLLLRLLLGAGHNHGRNILFRFPILDGDTEFLHFVHHHNYIIT